MAADYDNLSALGHRQAEHLGQYWAGRRIVAHRVFSGPAKRHQQTAQIVRNAVGRGDVAWPPIEPLPAMDEFDAMALMKQYLPYAVEREGEIALLHGAWQKTRGRQEEARTLQKLFEALSHSWAVSDFELNGVESFAKFRRRVGRAVDAARAMAPKGSHVVIFTSGGPIACGVGHALGLDDRRTMDLVWTSRNSGITSFLFSGERFSLSAFNAIPHLETPDMITYR